MGRLGPPWWLERSLAVIEDALVVKRMLCHLGVRGLFPPLTRHYGHYRLGKSGLSTAGSRLVATLFLILPKLPVTPARLPL